MTCASCGFTPRPGAVFCGNCGSRLDAPPPSSAGAARAAVAPPPSAVALAPGVIPAGQPSVAPVASPYGPPQAVPIAAPPIIAPPPTPGAVAPPTPAVTPPASDPGAAPADLDMTRVAPPRARRTAWTLELPDGSQYPVRGVLVIGRQPSLEAAVGATGVLTVDDTQVSKSHAAIEAQGGSLWVHNLGSTNGVVVIGPDGAETDVERDRVVVPENAEIDLGGYILIARRGS